MFNEKREKKAKLEHDLIIQEQSSLNFQLGLHTFNYLSTSKVLHQKLEQLEIKRRKIAKKLPKAPTQPAPVVAPVKPVQQVKETKK